jgi:hypothetical protein
MKKKDQNTLLIVGAAVLAGAYFLLKNNPVNLQPRSAAVPLQTAAPSQGPLTNIVQSVLQNSNTFQKMLPSQLPTNAPTVDIISSQPITTQYLTV